MVNYVKLAATAQRLIDANGRFVTVVQKGATAADSDRPWLGLQTNSDTEFIAKAIMFPYDAADVDGTRIQRFDSQAFVAADDVASVDPERCDHLYDGYSAYATAVFVYDNVGAGPVAGNTVTIGAKTYTFVSALTVANDVLIGVSKTVSLNNLAAAVNTDAGSGVTYGVGTTQNADVSAGVATLDTVHNVVHLTLTARVKGSTGNGVDSSTSIADLDAETTAGGRDVGRRFKIIKADILKPGDTSILFTMQLRS